MPYRPTRSSRSLLNRIAAKGKVANLVQPKYRSPLEYIVDGACYALLAGAIYFSFFAANQSWLIAGAMLFGAFVLWLVREFFVQDDHALVRIYGPLGRLRYVFEDLIRDKYLQYFNETNTDGRPIPRIARDYIYQIAHIVKSVASCGT